MTEERLNAILRPGRVAVVMGAGLGIGRALAVRLAGLGMAVTLVDVDPTALDEATALARTAAAAGHDAIQSAVADVADTTAMGRLAEQVRQQFGGVDLLINNAVTRIGRGFEAARIDWRRAFEINFWGVVNGVDVFLPGMLGGPSPRAIVNVGSKQGITNPPGHPIYNIAKSALKTYTEALAHDLRTRPDNQGSGALSVHLLVPGWTTTGRNAHQPGAWRPDQVVDHLLERMGRGDFYIVCPDGEVSEDMDRRRILWAAQDVTENRPPLSRWHPDFADAAKTVCSRVALARPRFISRASSADSTCGG